MHDPGQQFGRRLHDGRALNQTYRPFHVLSEFGAVRAGGQMSFERGLLLAVERTVHVIAKQDFDLRASHTFIFWRFRTLARSARPRFSLDFTVPSGTFNT